MTETIAKVAIPTPLRRLFDYRIPNNIDAPIGSRVNISFGRRDMVGLVLGHSNKTDVPANKLKNIDAVLDQKSLLTPDVLRLCEWASDYYHHAIGEVLSAALPTLLRQGEAEALRSELYWLLTEKGRTLDLEMLNEALKRAPKQIALINLLKQHDTGVSQKSLREADIPDSAVKAAQAKQLIKSFIKSPCIKGRAEPSNFSLSIAQLDAINTIMQSLNTFKTFLLEGVTGSGKTEVYLQVIKAALDQKKQALVLVPEISLTPQTIQRFQKRFSANITVLHSKLTDRERLNAWLLAKTGQANIVIGTRSAIFTPLRNIGVIIVDESHDLSYKQQEGFRYSARDLAIRRAQLNNIPVVLGSATPSLESLVNAKNDRYHLLRLPKRAGGAVAPTFRVVDIRNQYCENGLSRELLQAIKTQLAQNNQILLFLNRRGFAPTVMCRQCGWVAHCERCDMNMVLHQEHNHMHCHHCDSTHPIYPACPECGGKQLQSVGVGTERLEESLIKLFPQTKITRIDRDTTRKKNTLKAMLDSIHAGESQILVGTQMLAKGHHFPRVTLVGMIDCDGGFFSADFRALERIAQLMIQVAGRSGRGEQAGEVYIQTHQPHNPLLQTLIQKNYNAFANVLLDERRAANLPPFSYFALLRAEANNKDLPEKFLMAVKNLADGIPPTTEGAMVQLLGPIEAPMPKRAGRYRVQLLVQSNSRQHLHQLLKQLLPMIESLKAARQVRWSLDVDPMEMF